MSGARSARLRVTGGMAVAGAICAAFLATGTGASAASERATACPGPKIVTASGCASLGEARRQIHAIVNGEMEQNGLRRR